MTTSSHSCAHLRPRRRGPAGRHLGATAGALVLSAAAALALPAVASAHTIQPAGPYKLAIGWQHEPAYVGIENAVQVLVTGPDGKPYTAFPDSGSGLQVTVMFGKPGGGAQLPSSGAQPLTPTADPDTGLGTPGETLAPIIPTAAGDYTFHITGILGSQAVDITVSSGDTTFDAVRSAAPVEFPQQAQGGGEVQAAASRALSRADAATSAAGQAADSAQSAKDAATRALVVGLVALGVGVAVGASGLLVARRRARAARRAAGGD